MFRKIIPLKCGCKNNDTSNPATEAQTLPGTILVTFSHPTYSPPFLCFSGVVLAKLFENSNLWGVNNSYRIIWESRELWKKMGRAVSEDLTKSVMRSFAVD